MSNLQKIVVLCVVGGIILVGVFFVLNSYIYSKQQISENTKETDIAKQDIADEQQIKQLIESQSSIDTSNWILYSHETQGYSIQFPPEFERIEKDEFGFQFSVRDNSTGARTEIAVGILPAWVLIEFSEEEKKAFEWLRDAKVGDSSNNTTVIDKPDLDGCSAVQSENPIGITTLCFTEDRIVISEFRGYTQEQKELYNEILSTFQFRDVDISRTLPLSRSEAQAKKIYEFQQTADTYYPTYIPSNFGPGHRSVYEADVLKDDPSDSEALLVRFYGHATLDKNDPAANTIKIYQREKSGKTADEFLNDFAESQSKVLENAIRSYEVEYHEKVQVNEHEGVFLVTAMLLKSKQPNEEGANEIFGTGYEAHLLWSTENTDIDVALVSSIPSERELVPKQQYIDFKDELLKMAESMVKQ